MELWLRIRLHYPDNARWIGRSSVVYCRSVYSVRCGLEFVEDFYESLLPLAIMHVLVLSELRWFLDNDAFRVCWTFAFYYFHAWEYTYVHACIICIRATKYNFFSLYCFNCAWKWDDEKMFAMKWIFLLLVQIYRADETMERVSFASNICWISFQIL